MILLINKNQKCAKNGASNGIRLEKYCVEFAEMTIHETELMENVSKFVYGS